LRWSGFGARACVTSWQSLRPGQSLHCVPLRLRLAVAVQRCKWHWQWIRLTQALADATGDSESDSRAPQRAGAGRGRRGPGLGSAARRASGGCRATRTPASHWQPRPEAQAEVTVLPRRSELRVGRGRLTRSQPQAASVYYYYCLVACVSTAPSALLVQLLPRCCTTSTA